MQAANECTKTQPNNRGTSDPRLPTLSGSRRRATARHMNGIYDTVTQLQEVRDAIILLQNGVVCHTTIAK